MPQCELDTCPYANVKEATKWRPDEDICKLQCARFGRPSFVDCWRSPFSGHSRSIASFIYSPFYSERWALQSGRWRGSCGVGGCAEFTPSRALGSSVRLVARLVFFGRLLTCWPRAICNWPTDLDSGVNVASAEEDELGARASRRSYGQWPERVSLHSAKLTGSSTLWTAHNLFMHSDPEEEADERSK